MMRGRRGFGRLGTKASNRQAERLAGYVREKRSNGAAFTLIELLVVISIVVLLMALLLPSLQRVRNQARAVVCQTNLKQWGTILALYTEDNQGRLGSMGGALWLLRGPSLIEGDPNKPGVYQDINAKGIALCPMAVRSGGHGEFRSTASESGIVRYQIEGTTGSTFEAWEITSPLPPFRGSYGFNEGLFDRRGFNTSAHYRTRRLGTDIFSLRGRGRANIPTLLDSTGPWVHSVSERFGPPRSEFEGHSVCINRHNGHINVLFLDWSARKVGLKELWTLKWDSDWDTAGPWTKAGGVQPEDWPQWMRSFKDY